MKLPSTSRVCHASEIIMDISSLTFLKCLKLLLLVKYTRCPTKNVLQRFFSPHMKLTATFCELIILMGVVEHTFCSKSLLAFHRYWAYTLYTVMLCPSQQIHQMKRVKKLFFWGIHTLISHILVILQEIKVDMCYQEI